jgi:hypothetical protein
MAATTLPHGGSGLTATGRTLGTPRFAVKVALSGKTGIMGRSAPCPASAPSEKPAMNEPAPAVRVVFRIPGDWPSPKDMLDRLPAGCRLTADELILPDETRVEIGFLKADSQFAEIFRSSCRNPATAEELDLVDRYVVNITLAGPGGSLEAARAMMRAAAAIIEAGGAGVFIDNSGLAHGGTMWKQMTDDAGPDAVSFAFVSIIRGKADVWTSGMHVMGLCDIVMKRTDIEEGGYDIIEVLRYMTRSKKPVEDGHVLVDENGPRFTIRAEAGDPRLAGSAMHNPYGRLRLVSIKDIAEAN